MGSKFNVKSFAAGFAACAILVGSVAVYGQTITKNIEVAYNNIKVIVDGVEKTPSQEPFVYNGSTFVPLRFISESLGKKVTWDGDNKKIYIGDTNGTTKEAKQISLYDKPMADSAGDVTIDSSRGYITFSVCSFVHRKDIEEFKDEKGNDHFKVYAVYNLNGKATQLSGDFGIRGNNETPFGNSPDAYSVLKIYDENGKVMYQSDIHRHGMELSNFNIDVKNVSKVKLEFDAVYTAYSNAPIYPCIKNMTVTTTD